MQNRVSQLSEKIVLRIKTYWHKNNCSTDSFKIITMKVVLHFHAIMLGGTRLFPETMESRRAAS